MNENSIDYISRFNDLAQELSINEPSRREVLFDGGGGGNPVGDLSQWLCLVTVTWASWNPQGKSTGLAHETVFTERVKPRIPRRQWTRAPLTAYDMQPIGADHGLSPTSRSSTIHRGLLREWALRRVDIRNSFGIRVLTVLLPVWQSPTVWLPVKPSRGWSPCKRHAWCSFLSWELLVSLCAGRPQPLLLSSDILFSTWLFCLMGLAWWFLRANTLPGYLDHEAEKGPRVR